jgi:predicted DNA-binding protein (MmcQ/YjbR family)
VNIENFREYCLAKKEVAETFPFDENTMVMKVAGKMFALTDLVDSFRMNIKCDPEKAIERRERYASVIPGYHMNKTHWNTVFIDGTIPDKTLYEWIDESYDLVVKSIPKKLRTELGL